MSLPPEDIDPAIRTARARDFYLAYLNSPAWKTRRNRALHLAKWRCRRCPSKRDLQVHHTTYERLGAEWDSDLEVLCANCHEGHHLEETAKSDLGIYIRIASEVVREKPLDSIAELSESTKILCAKYRVPYDGAHIHRALELVTGRRFTRPTPKFKADGTEPSPTAWTAQEAHEFLCRVACALGGPLKLLKDMPTVDQSPAEREEHERRLRQQIGHEQRLQYLADRYGQKREPIQKQLDRIFEKRVQAERAPGD